MSSYLTPETVRRADSRDRPYRRASIMNAKDTQNGDLASFSLYSPPQNTALISIENPRGTLCHEQIHRKAM